MCIKVSSLKKPNLKLNQNNENRYSCLNLEFRQNLNKKCL